jgi:hypothetical protein
MISAINATTDTGKDGKCVVGKSELPREERSHYQAVEVAPTAEALNLRSRDPFFVGVKRLAGQEVPAFDDGDHRTRAGDICMRSGDISIIAQEKRDQSSPQEQCLIIRVAVFLAGLCFNQAFPRGARASSVPPH